MDVSYGTVDDKRDSIAVGNTMAYNNVFCSEYGKKTKCNSQTAVLWDEEERKNV